MYLKYSNYRVGRRRGKVLGKNSAWADGKNTGPLISLGVLLCWAAWAVTGFNHSVAAAPGVPEKEEKAESPNRLPTDITIRSFLLETNRLKINCPQQSYVLRDRTSSREIKRLPAGYACRLSRNQDRWDLTDRQGKNIWPADAPRAGEIEDIEVVPDPNGFIAVGVKKLNTYRGRLRLVSNAPDSFATVNVVDIESYLAGVLGAEMPRHWPRAALRAQCIAARTYALYYRNNNSLKDWDIGSTEESQMYGGLAYETQRSTETVHETSGLVLAWGPAGKEKLFPAYYSAICGGHTQDAEPVFGMSLAPLKGCSCPYCRVVAPPQCYQWPEVTLDKSKAQKLLLKKYPSLARLKRIVDIKIVQKSPFGRLERVKLTGSNGQESCLSGEELRNAWYTPDTAILSSCFELHDTGSAWRIDQGHGWGHGVGLCQYGSRQMARLGRDSVDILEYYYPQAVLLRAY